MNYPLPYVLVCHFQYIIIIVIFKLINEKILKALDETDDDVNRKSVQKAFYNKHNYICRILSQSIDKNFIDASQANKIYVRRMFRFKAQFRSFKMLDYLYKLFTTCPIFKEIT